MKVVAKGARRAAHNDRNLNENVAIKVSVLCFSKKTNGHNVRALAPSSVWMQALVATCTGKSSFITLPKQLKWQNEEFSLLPTRYDFDFFKIHAQGCFCVVFLICTKYSVCLIKNSWTQIITKQRLKEYKQWQK